MYVDILAMHKVSSMCLVKGKKEGSGFLVHKAQWRWSKATILTWTVYMPCLTVDGSIPTHWMILTVTGLDLTTTAHRKFLNSHLAIMITKSSRHFAAYINQTHRYRAHGDHSCVNLSLQSDRQRFVIVAWLQDLRTVWCTNNLRNTMWTAPLMEQSDENLESLTPLNHFQAYTLAWKRFKTTQSNLPLLGLHNCSISVAFFHHVCMQFVFLGIRIIQHIPLSKCPRQSTIQLALF